MRKAVAITEEAEDERDLFEFGVSLRRLNRQGLTEAVNSRILSDESHLHCRQVKD